VRKAGSLEGFFGPLGGALGSFHETGIADARAVLQCEIDAAGGVNIGAAFSAAIFVQFGHEMLPRFIVYYTLKRIIWRLR